MTNAWFIPKSHGYGARPANWKGWAAVAVFVAWQLALAFALMTGPSLAGRGPSPWQVGAWVLAMAVSSALFISVCRRKTEGDWRWRWGAASTANIPPAG